RLWVGPVFWAACLGDHRLHFGKSAKEGADLRSDTRDFCQCNSRRECGVDPDSSFIELWQKLRTQMREHKKTCDQGSDRCGNNQKALSKSSLKGPAVQTL